jgi:hypothetical protein
MTDVPFPSIPGFTLSGNQPLIGIPFEENGKEIVRYFSEEIQADNAVSVDTTQTALDLAGARSDLSWEEMEKELDRIGHQRNQPHLLNLTYETLSA